MTTRTIYAPLASGQTDIAVPSDYISRDFVKVYRRDHALGLTQTTFAGTLLAEGTDYTWLNAGTIRLTTPADGLTDYLAARDTQVLPLVEQKPGVFSSEKLNLAFTQALHLAEEAKGLMEGVSDLTLRNDLFANAGASLIGFQQAGTGTVRRTGQAKMRDIIGLLDFSSVSVADAAAGAKYVPEGIYDTTLAGAAITGRYWGHGQIRDGAARKRGPWYSHVNSRPVSSPITNHDWFETAFQGDWSKAQIAMQHLVTGAATLGQPTTGYLYTPEAMPLYIRLRNESGWNQATAGNGGRTGIAGIRVHVDQYGQGDAACFNGTAFVIGRRPGSTDFLADPAGVIFNGDITIGEAGCYANMGEFAMNDNGLPAAAIGWVVNGYRTTATTVRGSFWAGYRAQSQGSVAMDQAFGMQGLFTVGFDAVTATCLRPIALKAGQRIALNDFSTNGRWADGQNGDYISYDSGLGGINCVVFGSSTFQMVRGAGGGQVSVVGVPFAANNNVILTGLAQYASDAAAASGGVPLSGLYRDASGFLKQRVA